MLIQILIQQISLKRFTITKENCDHPDGKNEKMKIIKIRREIKCLKTLKVFRITFVLTQTVYIQSNLIKIKLFCKSIMEEILLDC